MERIAVEAGSVISASLFGALAGAGVVPFARQTFEETIRASGRGVEASLKAFGKACERAQQGGVAEEAVEPSGRKPLQEAEGAPHLLSAWKKILDRIAKLPVPVREMAELGARKVVDFQDAEYGADYLDRLDEAVARDCEAKGYELSKAAAKYLANAMCYDDIIRVADLKTRSARSARVRREIGVGEDAVLHVTEYFHPRIEEFCGTMPAGLGSWIESKPSLAEWLDKRLNKGRHMRTDGMFGFSVLWAIAGLRRWRRRLLRHRIETAHIEEWHALALGRAETNYDLAVEILKCRRLIKGYSDTHARGLSKFDRVLSALPMLETRNDAADWLRRLREAALKDEKGKMLDGALATVASFAAAGNSARD
jgi:indolepyruvate ferredoxin oxidoreductase beta subunit